MYVADPRWLATQPTNKAHAAPRTLEATRTPTPPTLEAYLTLPLSLPHATPPPQPT